MLEGIYKVSFSSNDQDHGEGIVVIKNNAINGGDYGYVYKGLICDNTTKLSVEQWNPTSISVFGSLTKFNLELTFISKDQSSFTATGNIENAPQFEITIQGTMLSSTA